VILPHNHVPFEPSLNSAALHFLLPLMGPVVYFLRLETPFPD
jgi:hypothetical protein